MLSGIMSYPLSNRAVNYATGFGLDLAVDIIKMGLSPDNVEIAIVKDGHQRIETHHFDNKGVDYYSSRFDFSTTNKAIASRVMACIMPGNRTWFGYRPLSNEPLKLLVHQGSGYLIIGDPLEAALNSGLATKIYPLTAGIISKITVPSGRFYCLEAASWTEVPFVVSGISAAHKDGEWDKPEVTLEPGEAEVTTPDGTLLVPDDFVSANFS